jgi:hypothetical protein
MITNINYHIWFKACRSIKRKYKLSTNCLLVLNGVYVYSVYVVNSFTRRKVEDVMTYYDSYKIRSYMTVLITHGFIIESGLYKGHQLYSVSPLGLTVIQELNSSYQEQFNKFIDQYNITL